MAIKSSWMIRPHIPDLSPFPGNGVLAWGTAARAVTGTASPEPGGDPPARLLMLHCELCPFLLCYLQNENCSVFPGPSETD